MNRYFATVIPGFTHLIQTQLIIQLQEITFLRVDESSLLFETNLPIARLQKITYFNALFLVLASFPIEKEMFHGSIVKKLHTMTSYAQYESDIQQIGEKAKTFRMMVQQGSKLIHIPRQISKKIITEISNATHLQYTPLKSQIEFWAFIRTEGIALYGLKINIKLKEEYIEHRAGELRPKMAALLNLLSEPKATDVYCDPFAGYGALARERASAPYQHIYISDLNQHFITQLKLEFQTHKNISIHQSDACKLTYLQDNSLTTIVTDPPWGMYQLKEVDYKVFYFHMLQEFYRVLQSNGKAVIITAKVEELEFALRQLQAKAYNINCQQKISTLVNGKKASALKIQFKCYPLLEKLQ